MIFDAYPSHEPPSTVDDADPRRTGMRILVVDDEPAILRWVERLLVERGHRVVSRTDGASGWEAASSTPFDLAIIDLRLPDLSGLELCRRIRRDSPSADALLLVFTAETAGDILAEVLDSGADDYLAKPCDAATLGVRLTVAEQRLEVRRSRRRGREELAFRYGLEEIVASLSTRLINLPGGALEESLVGGVELIAAYAGMGGANLFLADAAGEVLGCLFGWRNDGTETTAPGRLPIARVARFWERLAALDPVEVSAPGALPAADREELVRLGIGQRNALVCVPIAVGGCLRGAIVFETAAQSRFRFTASDGLLRVLGEVYGNALQRVEHEGRLRRRLDLEALVTNLSSRLAAAPLEEMEQVLGDALRYLSRFIGAARACFHGCCAGARPDHRRRWCSSGDPEASPEGLVRLESRLAGKESLGLSRAAANGEEVRRLLDELQVAGGGALLSVAAGGGDAPGLITLFFDHASPPLPEEDFRMLQLAGALFSDASRRLEAERARLELLRRTRGQRDDLRSILDLLRVGTALIDGEGRLSFLSRGMRRIFGVSLGDVEGVAWREALPLGEGTVSRLVEMVGQPAERRERGAFRFHSAAGRDYWLEAEVHDDPRGDGRRIILFYDVSEIHDLRLRLDGRAEFHDMIGKSDAMQALFAQIREVASVDWSVLIQGETGTGKELVARALHTASARAGGPFIPVNCAGLTESLLTSQLFGHKRGAFTGAISDHKGLFEEAEGGTLFLDEIGDVPLSVQTNLLRVLQERAITRVGEAQPRPVDVRIVAASHKDLASEVEAGRFRADLLYRVRAARIALPPLRERRDDIPLLVSRFIERCRAESGKEVGGIGPEAMETLLTHDWPGNIRELEHAIEYAHIQCRGGRIERTDLPPEVRAAPPSASRFVDTTAVVVDERSRILQALEAAGGNRTKAAKLLGIGRATLYRRLDEFKINR